jgi:hypothetical protein
MMILISCKSISERSDSYYRSCINKKTQKKLNNGYGVEKDIFTLLKETESSLLKNKIIPDISNESYLKLVDFVFNDKETSLKIKTIIETNVNSNFFDFLSLSSLDFFSECPDEVFKKVKDSNEKMKLRKRFTIYAELTTQGFNNKEKFIELINETQNISELETQRLTLLHVILLNIGNNVP